MKFTRPLVSIVRYFRMAATLVLLIWSELRSKPATFDTLVASRGKRPSSLARVFVLKRQRCRANWSDLCDARNTELRLPGDRTGPRTVLRHTEAEDRRRTKCRKCQSTGADLWLG